MSPKQQNEPIAIIGSACHFPGEASTSSKLWELLRQPRDVLKPIDVFNPKGFYNPNGEYHGSSNIQHSYFISEDTRRFDAQFFNINPREADSIDPQQKMLLETVYEAMESAGLTIEELQGSQTAVYVGLMCADYLDVLMRDVDSLPQYFATSTARSILSNRISYFFDWNGPSMTIDTACSSSLVAIHQAAETLRSGTSRVAVAAGANLIFGPEMYIAESSLHMLSPDGRSKMWDEGANGYARGEGIAAVMLKTLSAAIEDGDHIECIIRETGVNQDGRTKGITMPSGKAQAALIRQTYEKAGLDWSNKLDRPQYFEAHGTGTPAGDPQEAEAIRNAFFGSNSELAAKDDRLYVGSIKTIVGHTEGTAGVAGVMKVSLALQNGTIPPNMLFNRLAPAVKPFYNNLKIPTTATKWPALPDGVPRRASVNSFGFGGTNAHAILESYTPPAEENKVEEATLLGVVPLTFSANSERSLVGTIESYRDYLKSNKSVNLRDLAWTLYAKRSAFPIKATFSGLTQETLVAKIDSQLQKAKDAAGAVVGTRSINKPGRILGVFTGQGAQWASMGKELILSSPLFRDTIESLEKSLAELPEADRPSWSLKSEIMADAKTSRLSKAELSQPLCTAVQVALVNLLRESGIKFSAVVGHSSGEIAAAYTAGFVSATDAIRIAYYRGFHAKLAGAADGSKGAMMAVGTTMEDIQELCELPDFEGRITLAASNSPSSVTVSGDADAINEAKDIFDEEKKFSRVLKVDTAYHSHHMYPCSEPYVESLRVCGVQVQEREDTSCQWFSSVDNELAGRVVEPSEALKGVYWKENMVNAVLFSQAVESAVLEAGPFDIALEVGPHPALKGPASETIKETADASVPYHGVLSRGANDVEAFSDALGFVWTQLGASAVNFDGYRLAFDSTKPKMVQDLPNYAWDHSQVYFRESRLSKKFRKREEPVHELLGTKNLTDSETEHRWRNIVKLDEVPWLRGHQLQGQTVFPGAGYVAMILEAAKSLPKPQQPIKLIEIHDLVIHRAIAFNDNSPGVEIVFTLKVLDSETSNSDLRVGEFACYSVGDGDGPMALIFNGRVEVTIGEPIPDILPTRNPPAPGMMDVDVDRFYASLDALGYGYSSQFRTLNSIKRKLNYATATVTKPSVELPDRALMLHPAVLDVAFHAVFAGFCAPGDGTFWTLHVPTSIRRIRVNPALCEELPSTEIDMPCDAFITKDGSAAICGDVEIFSPRNTNNMAVQVTGLRCVPFSTATAADDRQMFSQMVWDVDRPNGDALVRDEPDSSEEVELNEAVERVAYFYLKKLEKEVTSQERALSESYHKRLFQFIENNLPRIINGTHPTTKKEWVNDTHEDILALVSKYPGRVDLELAAAVGENLHDVIRGQSTLLEHVTENNMLERLYKEGLGFTRTNTDVASIVGQLAHRYQKMKILEIGAGTGATTTGVLETLRGAFQSYTYTDLSSESVERAKSSFKSQAKKMNFQTLDIGADVGKQGYSDHSYDLIIASSVRHTTAILSKTLSSVRRMLKPGGTLILLGYTGETLRPTFLLGGFPGWWLGVDDGPTISPVQWDSLLVKSGFSGVDVLSQDLTDSAKHSYSVLVTQAVDDRVEFLRQPLTSTYFDSQAENLVILGGKTLQISKLVEQLRRLVGRWFKNITVANSLESLDTSKLPASATIISLTELDEPFFKTRTPEKKDALNSLFEKGRNLLWVTRGSRGDNPYHSIIVGVARAIAYEVPQLRFQLLDLDFTEKPDIQIVAEVLLRLQGTEPWETEEGLESDIVWTTEPELAHEKGRFLIPRIVPNPPLNDRLNSAKRNITKEVAPHSSSVAIERSGTSYILKEKPTSASAQTSDVRLIQNSVSLLSSIKATSGSYLYVSLGSEISTGEIFVALSETNASIIEVPSTWTTPSKVSAGDEAQVILSVAANIIARNVLSVVSPGKTLLLHEPEEALASVISERAAEKGVNVLCTTSKNNITSSLWVFVHARASERVIKYVLPDNVELMVDFSISTTGKAVAARIATCASSSCLLWDSSEVFRSESFVRSDSAPSEVSDALSKAVALSTSGSIIANTIALQNITDNATEKHQLSVVEWLTKSTVSVEVEPVNPKHLFGDNKTYFLVGLTGELGRSLCQWMVEAGARYLVLTSRNPQVDQTWLDMLKAKGATVKTYAMDITDKQSLRSVYDDICKTMPPIAGVANGAMIMRDRLFNDMSFADFDGSLKPKVEGTTYLDEIFSEDTLDFFIVFSSLSCITGNGSQTNYGAGNQFMSTLTANRRKRGLAASAIDIGSILGIGYIAHSENAQAIEKQLAKYNYMPLSETDFHTIFAEGVLAGRPESRGRHEVISGLLPAQADDDVKPPWFNNPKFSHYVVDNGETRSTADTKTASVPLKKQLEAARTKQEVGAILRKCFAAKVESVLQLPTDSVSDNVPLVELGVDSLVAVEVRTWFLKELNTDMPVLKVLSGGSVADLCADAQERLPEALVPNLGAAPGKDTKKPTSIEVKVPVPTAPVPTVPVREIPSAPSSVTGLSGTQTPPTEKSTPPETPYPISESGKSEYFSAPAEFTMQRTEKLSYGQARFWFLRMYLQNDPTTFNVTIKYRLTGAVRVADLERAVHSVAQRHESLRTVFFADASKVDQATQGVLEKSSLRLERKHIKSEADVDHEFGLVRDNVYDLERGDTMRVVLLSESPKSHWMVIGYHHIIMDGVSLQIFLTDLEKAYNSQSMNSPTIQYVDYAVRQRKLIESGGLKQQLEYWQKEFATIPEPLPLFPFARVRSRRALKVYEFNKIDLWVDPALTARIKQAGQKLKATQFHFYLAALQVLLYRFLKIDDFAIGIADANKNEEDVLETVGFFLNLLPLRFRPKGSDKFADSVRDARTKAYSAIANGAAPIDVILDELNVPRSATHSPLFQVLVNYRLGVLEKLPFGDCELEALEAQPGRTAYDITFDLSDSTSGASLFTLWTQKSLYTYENSEIIMKSFINLLDAFSRNSNMRLDDAPLFARSDIQAAIEIGRGKRLQSDWPETISHQVDAIAEKNPNRVALKDGSGNVFTYSQMIKRSNVIAMALLDAGVSDCSRVAVFQEPTSDWVCSLLAILRVGASYIPLDLRNPLARLSAIVGDCQPSAILAHEQTIADAPGLLTERFTTTIINISKPSNGSVAPIPTRARANSPAIILYTSGSTGTPKGITLMHYSIRNQIEGVAREYNLDKEVVMQQSSLGFDLSLDQIFNAIANGGTLFVVPRETRADPIELTRLMETEKITYTMGAPSEYSLWLRYGTSHLKQCTSWRTAFSAGEVLTDLVKQQFRELNMPQLSLMNAYGPSEACVSSNRMKVPYVGEEGDTTSDDFFPVGASLPNYSVYVVDENLKPVPIGMPGEILIGGAGTAAGYVSNQELTASKFVPDAYAPAHYASLGWEKMYRTGDKGRWRRDGALVYQGRMDGDTQIKLRGLRIELEDIENTILRTSGGNIVDAIVSVRGDPQTAFLVAHVVFSPETRPADPERYLKKLSTSLPLPQYMWPSMLIPLDRMPLNANGKTDRRAIAALQLPEISNSDVSNLELNETESQLIQVWKEVLSEEVAKLYKINQEADFFQVGGSSLLLVRLQAVIRQKFDILIPLVELFQSSTLGDMASRIAASHVDTPASVINWEEETALSKVTLQEEASLVSVTATKPIAEDSRVVLLTGATGFLGVNVLKKLVDDDTVAKIYTVAVRQANKVPIISNKVTVYTGDLSEPLLGLSEAEFKALSLEVDVIIHNGADVSFLKTYHSLRKPNVNSTKTLVKMALPRKIPIHYVSTGGVMHLTERPEPLKEVSIAQFLPPTDGSDGYVSTKWASEKYLEKAAEQLELPVWIHRPTNVTGEGAPELDIVHNFLKFAISMKSVPSLDSWPGRFDLVPVETVSQDLHRAISDKPTGKFSVKYVHHCSDKKLTMVQLREKLERDTGSKFDTVSLEDWVSRARGLGLDYMVGAFIENLDFADAKSALPLLTKGGN